LIEQTAAVVIDSAVKVHRAAGPGLLESAYERMLEYELLRRGQQVERQKYLSLVYEDLEIDRAYCIDLLVNECVVVEVKSIDAVLPVHMKQVLTYLKLSHLTLGLLLNFGQTTLKTGGIHRLINGQEK
jgi:GxxExxY protein